MYYSYSTSKIKPYTVTCAEFPSIEAAGDSKEIAFSNFLTKVFDYIKLCLKDGIPIPDNQNLPRTKGKTFGLPLNMALKIRLHNIRLQKKVSRKELAQFLTVKPDELNNMNCTIETLKNISQDKMPKYKNVQRLFDISHDSTIRELETAYRILGFNVSALPLERN